MYYHFRNILRTINLRLSLIQTHVLCFLSKQVKIAYNKLRLTLIYLGIKELRNNGKGIEEILRQPTTRLSLRTALAAIAVALPKATISLTHIRPTLLRCRVFLLSIPVNNNTRRLLLSILLDSIVDRSSNTIDSNTTIALLKLPNSNSNYENESNNENESNVRTTSYSNILANTRIYNTINYTRNISFTRLFIIAKENPTTKRNFSIILDNNNLKALYIAKEVNRLKYTPLVKKYLALNLLEKDKVDVKFLEVIIERRQEVYKILTFTKAYCYK
ncbi:hypothetical protein J3E73DRAFT_388840 [Bipolaris maydis]|nr:hypothetical protein J3E73DRAFT_388840 [Bipolaris maydis]